ncbi:MAG: hypothetical protein ACRDL0_22210 [Thermoleophilaceae bacterium]
MWGIAVLPTVYQYPRGAAVSETSFLGAQALREEGPSFETWLALVCFFGVGVCALASLWPRAWEFTASPRDVTATYVEGDEPLELAAIHRDLALHMQASYLANQAGLERLIV